MNWDQLEGKWKQVTGSVKARWGKLTDDDLRMISGHKDQLVGRIQERYGIHKEEAERQVEDWNSNLGEANETERENRLKRAS